MLAGNFYRALTGPASQWDVASALARAQRSMLAQAEHAHPYYWAGYVLTGRR